MTIDTSNTLILSARKRADTRKYSDSKSTMMVNSFSRSNSASTNSVILAAGRCTSVDSNGLLQKTAKRIKTMKIS